MRPLRRWAAVLLLCAPLAARAGFRCPAKGGAEWREYRSKHFVVDTDASRFKVELLVAQLERMHVLELQALFGEQVEIPGRVRVLALRIRTSSRTWQGGTSALSTDARGCGSPSSRCPSSGSRRGRRRWRTRSRITSPVSCFR